jgi:hypothetical protein
MLLSFNKNKNKRYRLKGIIEVGRKSLCTALLQHYAMKIAARYW